MPNCTNTPLLAKIESTFCLLSILQCVENLNSKHFCSAGGFRPITFYKMDHLEAIIEDERPIRRDGCALFLTHSLLSFSFLSDLGLGGLFLVIYNFDLMKTMTMIPGNKTPFAWLLPPQCCTQSQRQDLQEQDNLARLKQPGFDFHFSFIFPFSVLYSAFVRGRTIGVVTIISYRLLPLLLLLYHPLYNQRRRKLFIKSKKIMKHGLWGRPCCREVKISNR